MSINKGRAAAVIVAVAAIGFGAAGAANARPAGPDSATAAAAAAPANSVISSSIKDGEVKHPDIGAGQVSESNLYGPFVKALYGVYDNTVKTPSIVNGAVTEDKLAAAVKTKLNSTTGQVTALEADGPYPGSTKLQDFPGNGANSTDKVPADAKSHAVWVQCADGKTALGGGFRLGADQGDAVASKIQVTASEPTQIKDGAVVYEPIAGDAAGSVEPNGWLVEVINSGDTDATVRPWVTCAKVAK